MQPCRLAASELACRRGDRVLFGGLSLALGPGEALLLTGPNGAGKSSLLRMLAGLLRPFEGQIEREGQLALLDERVALEPDLPLVEALKFWARVDSAGPETVAHALATVGLDPQAEVPVGYLSTGQRKRAGLARVLVQRANIWLLDEPTNGLDTASVARVSELVAAHRAGGGIAVVASHLPVELPGAQRIAL